MDRRNSYKNKSLSLLVAGAIFGGCHGKLDEITTLPLIQSALVYSNDFGKRDTEIKPIYTDVYSPQRIYEEMLNIGTKVIDDEEFICTTLDYLALVHDSIDTKNLFSEEKIWLESLNPEKRSDYEIYMSDSIINDASFCDAFRGRIVPYHLSDKDIIFFHRLEDVYRKTNEELNKNNDPPIDKSWEKFEEWGEGEYLDEVDIPQTYDLLFRDYDYLKVLNDAYLKVL